MTRAWHLVRADEVSEWDALLLQARDRNVFQSAGWGEYKRAAGWTPIRWVGQVDGRTVMIVQLLTRKLPFGVLLAWAPGGPVFGFEGTISGELGAWIESLLGHIRRGSMAAYVRFDSYVADDADAESEMSAALLRPMVRVNTGLTLVLDVRRRMDALLADMSSGHRRHLRRGMGAGLRWRTGRSRPLVEDLVLLHRDMLATKGLRERHRSTVSELVRLLEESDGARVTVGYLRDEPVTAGLVLQFGRRAILQTPATGRLGRGISASYALVVRVIEELQAEGVADLDLAGLSQTSHARGVDQFKRGFGGTVSSRIGEWEWASHRALQLAMNIALVFRGRDVTG